MRTTSASGGTTSSSKSDYAYDQLKARIIDGSLPPGGVVSQEPAPTARVRPWSDSENS